MATLFRRVTHILFQSTSIALIAVSLMVWCVYHTVRPTRSELSPRQQALVEDLVEQARARFAELTPLRRPTVFLPLGRDRFAVLSDPLRTVLQQSDRFDLLEPTIYEKLLKNLEWTRPTVSNRSEAVSEARSRRADYVVWGVVDEFADLGDHAVLRVALHVEETATGITAYSHEFSLSDQGLLPLLNKAGDALSPSTWSPISMLVLWAVFTLLLPLATYPLTRRTVTADSNLSILASLAAHVLASVIAAYALVLRGSTGWTSMIVLLVIFALALMYMYRALSVIKYFNE